MLQGLTTFNLGTSNKQKLAKDQVALPFWRHKALDKGVLLFMSTKRMTIMMKRDPYEDPF
ncbi:ANL_collapsed_G0025080.mRNA.1.CDS.1 [Saccharomyces cerevisiae]|nr:ANL_collapsed_G0025080.mRNA.1.CDS.1 [Saccharomyces cerevisiae]